jgi:hydrogenase expression/formation protein HypC
VGLSSPGRVVSVESDQVGIVDIEGVHTRVRFALLTAAGTRVAVGDWLLVQLGLAVASLDPAEASELARLIAATAGPAAAAPSVIAARPAIAA